MATTTKHVVSTATAIPDKWSAANATYVATATYAAEKEK
jgi:hypothetical protein